MRVYAGGATDDIPRHDPVEMILIPFRELSPEALTALIEDFVTRDGTDYGEREVPLDVRSAQVRRQLEAGTACIVYDEDEDSVTIVPRESLPRGLVAETAPDD